MKWQIEISGIFFSIILALIVWQSLIKQQAANLYDTEGFRNYVQGLIDAQILSENWMGFNDRDDWLENWNATLGEPLAEGIAGLWAETVHAVITDAGYYVNFADIQFGILPPWEKPNDHAWASEKYEEAEAHPGRIDFFDEEGNPTGWYVDPSCLLPTPWTPEEDARYLQK